MVKSVIAEESQSQLTEDRLLGSGVTVEVGLVIGKLNADSDRGFIYNFIPTPPTEAGGPPCSLKSEGIVTGDKKKGSKGGKSSSSAETSASLLIDGDWVAEHARQVSNMLLGGMNVVGIYLWASEAAFKATSPALLAQVARNISQADDSDCDERLLVHVSYSPRRWAYRICTLATGNIRPCEFKTGKLLASLQSFRCKYDFELRLPVSESGPLCSATLKKLVRDGISHIAKDLQSAKALVDGNLVTNELQSSSQKSHEVELLLPFKKDVYFSSTGKLAGLLVFSGTICASAYLAPKESIAQAISDLKGDIVSSLKSRLDIISDEAEGEEGLISDDGTRQSGDASATSETSGLSFPRRVFAPWLDGVFICDYLHALENLEDMKDRCREMLSMDFPDENSGVEEAETIPTSIRSRSFRDVVNEHSTPPIISSIELATKEINPDAKRSNVNIIAAAVVLLLAFLVALAVTSFGPRRGD